MPGTLVTGCGETDDVTTAESEHAPAPATSLEAAVVVGDVDAVQAHIAAGTRIDEPNMAGDTPLSVAAVFGHASVAELLIEAGADLESTNNAGTTPLFNAAFFCHPDVLRLLIAAGASTTPTDQFGTPIQQIMQTPWAGIEPVYAAVYGSIGLPFDPERIESTRPQIAEMLR